MSDTRKVRFYNAGDRIQCTIRYSNPAGHDIHCTAYHRFDAPEAGFVEVPEETELEGARIRFSFDRDIMRDWGPRGCIMIDANYIAKENREQDDVFPIAASIPLAIEKGKRKWTAFVADRVKEFLDQCEQIRAAGGVPRPATGAMLRYLKISGMVDPSQAMLRESQKQTSLVETLTERLDRLEAENKKLREDQELEVLTAPAGKGKGKGA